MARTPKPATATAEPPVAATTEPPVAATAPPPVTPITIDHLQERILLKVKDLEWHPVDSLLAAFFRTTDEKKDGKKAKKQTEFSDEQRQVVNDAINKLEHVDRLEQRELNNGGVEVKATPLVADRFTLDDEFRSLIDPASPDEEAEFENGMMTATDVDALIVWKGQGILLDGYRRYAMLSLFGRKPKIVEKEFATREEAKAWLVRFQHARRNSSEMWKAYQIGCRYNEEKDSHGGPRSAKGASAESAHMNTGQAIAKAYNLDAATVRRHAKFAADLDKVATVLGEDVIKQIRSRRLPWTFGDVRKVARLDRTEMKRIFKEAQKDGKRPKFNDAPAQKTIHRQATSLVERLQKSGKDKPLKFLNALAKLLGCTVSVAAATETKSADTNGKAAAKTDAEQA